MRIWIFSDLHFEFYSSAASLACPQADLCICAGDVRDRGLVPSIQWLGENVSGKMPVLFVPGNHEFYRASLMDSLIAGRAAVESYPDLHLMEGQVVRLEGMAFVGATLWTDYALHGNPHGSMLSAELGMNDYRRIKLRKLPYQRLRPNDLAMLHLDSKRKLQESLATVAGQMSIVVTHHAPSPRSLPQEWKNDFLSPAYASDLEDMIDEYEPWLWVHGHIHRRCDYRIGKTRVICNPRGYPGEPSEQAFDPELIVDTNER